MYSAISSTSRDRGAAPPEDFQINPLSSIILRQPHLPFPSLALPRLARRIFYFVRNVPRGLCPLRLSGPTGLLSVTPGPVPSQFGLARGCEIGEGPPDRRGEIWELHWRPAAASESPPPHPSPENTSAHGGLGLFFCVQLR